MTQKGTTKNRVNLSFLVLQEAAWILGLVAMTLDFVKHEPGWIWISLLICWQAAILWGFVKLRRARTS